MLLPLVMRWLHILAAITAVGGSLFMWLVLIPSAGRALDDAAHTHLRQEIRARWQRIVHTCILLFLVSGFYNYFAVTRHLHDGQALYHALFGVKFLLALGVFALALLLTSSRSATASIRARNRLWLGVLLVLAVAVVLMSGYMRAMPHVPAPL